METPLELLMVLKEDIPEPADPGMRGTGQRVDVPVPPRKAAGCGKPYGFQFMCCPNLSKKLGMRNIMVSKRCQFGVFNFISTLD